MSLDALIWAVKSAKVADVEEFAVLSCLADEAAEDGTGAFLSTKTIARRTTLSERTVQRRIDDMEARRLLGRGDQSKAAYIRADRRPVVWDLLIPAESFANLARINEARVDRGLPPITPASRPMQADPPPRKRRADLGIKRGVQDLHPDPEQEEHDDPTMSHPVGGVTTSPTGLEAPHGVTSNPPRGVRQSPDPVLDPVLDPKTPPTPPRVDEAPPAVVEADGGDLPPAGNPNDLGDGDRDRLNQAVRVALEARQGSPLWTRALVVAAIEKHLAEGHPAADVAKAMCDAAGDPSRTHPGGIGYLLAKKAAPAEPAPAWTEGPIKYLAPGTAMCRIHQGEPAHNCNRCAADAKAVDDARPVDRLDAAAARELARANARNAGRGKHRPEGVAAAAPAPEAHDERTDAGRGFHAALEAMTGQRVPA